MPKSCVGLDAPTQAKDLDALAAAMREDFNRFLIRDGVVAGYGVFGPEGGPPELLLHPSDRSDRPLLLAASDDAGNYRRDSSRPAQSRRHLGLIRKHLLFPDGARLMDRPIAYHGGPETIFRRAESAAFFGREIGLMYVHSHLRYAEAMAVLGEAEALWDALLVANPIAVTDRLAHASLRQRNAYFSSSDAAFQDRYQASAAWDRVKAGTDRRRRRLAHLFERTGPLHQHPHPACVRDPPAISASGSSSRACPRSQKGLSLAWPRRPAAGSRRR